MKEHKKPCRARLTMLALAVMACICVPPENVAQAHSERLNQRIQFDIPPQPLATALVLFSKQAQVQLVAANQDLGEHQAPDVTGMLPIALALDMLLDHTGLAYGLVGENTVAIAKPNAHGSQASRGLTSLSPGDADAKRKEGETGFWHRFRLAQVDQEKTAGAGAAYRHACSATACVRSRHSYLLFNVHRCNLRRDDPLRGIP